MPFVSTWKILEKMVKNGYRKVFDFVFKDATLFQTGYKLFLYSTSHLLCLFTLLFIISIMICKK